MTTIQIKYCDIPAYLHKGEFYRSLDGDNPEETFEIPTDCFHPQCEAAADIEEFRQMLRVLVFWLLDDIPLGVLDFCVNHEVDVWTKAFVDLPGGVGLEVQPLLLTAYSDPHDIPLENIINTGRWELIMHALTRSAKSSPATRIAARWGNLRLLQYLHEHEFEWHEDTCAAASKGGHLDCLKYAHDNGCPWDVDVFISAAQNGNLACMKYAYENGVEWHAAVCKEAALGGHLHCLQFARENGCPWDNMTTRNAAQEGHVDCLAYAHENGCPWNTDVYLIAAHNGHLHCMQYAFSQGLEWHADVCKEAALNGHLDCLQFAHEHGCPWNHNVLLNAAMGGHLSCLQYAHEHGCEWMDVITYAAVQSGSLDCLKYAHEHGCPWHYRTTRMALVTGQWRCLSYAVQNGAAFWTVLISLSPCIAYIPQLLRFCHCAYDVSTGNNSERGALLISLFLLVLLSGVVPLNLIRETGPELRLYITQKNQDRIEGVAVLLVLCGMVLMVYALWLLNYHGEWMQGKV